MRPTRFSVGWRWSIVIALFALVAAACQPGPGAETTTTAPPDDTTETTEAPTTEPVDGFTYRTGMFSDMTTDNYWTYLGQDTEVWNAYVFGPTRTSLFTIAYPDILLVPALATGMPADPVQEGDVWVVEQEIREGFAWSDGTPITAEDFAFTWNTARDFGLGGNWLNLAKIGQEDDPATEEDESRDGVIAVEAVDERTVRITFNAAPGLSIWQHGVGFLPWMAKHFWEDAVNEAAGSDDPAATLYAASGIGDPSAGSFTFEGREPGAFASSVANPEYYYRGTQVSFHDDGSYRQASDAQGFEETYYGDAGGAATTEFTVGPFAAEVTYSIFTSQDAAVLALRDGEVDFLFNPLGLQRGLRDQLVGQPDIDLIANPSNGIRYLAFNVRSEPMSFQGFRDAIACMIDKEFMATSVLQGAALPLYSLIPEANTFWHPEDKEEFCKGLSEQERLEIAVEALRADGFTWDSEPAWDEDNATIVSGEGIRLPNGSLVGELELLAPGPGYDPLRATYSIWIEQWANDLGIPVRANPTAFSLIVDKVFGPVDWDMYILGWSLGNPALPDFHEAFFASYNDSAAGGFNVPGYNSPEFDELAGQLLAATEIEEARELVQAMDAMILEDKPYVVLFDTPILEAYRNTLQFPFTDTLSGLQDQAGMVSTVSLAQ